IVYRWKYAAFRCGCQALDAAHPTSFRKSKNRSRRSRLRIGTLFSHPVAEPRPEGAGSTVLEISFPQSCNVVGEVPGDQVGQSPDRELIVAGDPGSHPCIGGQIPKKRNGREAYAPEFLQVGSPG